MVTLGTSLLVASCIIILISSLLPIEIEKAIVAKWATIFLFILAIEGIIISKFTYPPIYFGTFALIFGFACCFIGIVTCIFTIVLTRDMTRDDFVASKLFYRVKIMLYLMIFGIMNIGIFWITSIL